MFLNVQRDVAVPPSEAQRRVEDALRTDGLLSISSSAFAEGARLLLRAGVLGVTKQVEVQALSPYRRDDAVVVVAFTWHATGFFGDLFPVFDANLELSPSDRAGHTTITLVGSYRPPAGKVGRALDRVLMHQVAQATAEKFLDQVNAVIQHSARDTSAA